jgi:methanogenic corrinoid protein MtbC1
MSEILSKISEAIIEGKVDDMVDLAEEALDDGISAQDVLDKGLMAGMDYVGAEFKAGNMLFPRCYARPRQCRRLWTC